MNIGQLQKMCLKYDPKTPIEIEISHTGKHNIKVRSAHTEETSKGKIRAIVFSPLYDIFPIPE